MTTEDAGATGAPDLFDTPPRCLISLTLNDETTQGVIMTRKAAKNRFIYCVLGFAVFFFICLAMETAVHARVGGGRSSGSRGFSSGGSFQRSTPTSPSRQPTQPRSGMTQQRPLQQPSSGIGRGLMYGLGGLFLGGMIGSLLFGGHGQAAGWGGTGGFGMGDLIIVLVILGIVYFIVKRFRARREAMQMSSAGAGYAPYAYDQPQAGTYSGEPQEADEPGDGLGRGLRHIAEMDPGFSESAFRETAEDLFFRIQSAWTKRDLGPARQLLSAEMLNVLQADANRYVADKQFNRLENVAVRSVEIVDAAQDRGEEYITVKFTASLLDYVVSESTGDVVSGSASNPVKFLEYWTFSRKVGDKQWVLSGITQQGDYEGR